MVYIITTISNDNDQGYKSLRDLVISVRRIFYLRLLHTFRKRLGDKASYAKLICEVICLS